MAGLRTAGNAADGNRSRLLRAAGRGLAVLALAALAALLWVDQARTTATFVVNSQADATDASPGDGNCAASGGACTLRAAIQESNALAGADRITVPSGVYQLAIPPVNANDVTSGDLDITDAVVITGAGRSVTFIDGGVPKPGSPPDVRGMDRLFEVHPSAGDVDLTGLTIREGYASEYGGAIYNAGAATIDVASSVLQNNGAGKSGGAIDNHADGTVRVSNSTVTGNAASEGSALNNNAGGRLEVTGGSVSSNSGGAAIENHGDKDLKGTVTVTDTTVSYNIASGAGRGGGINNDGWGNVTVVRTTVLRNASAVDGGGISNDSGTVLVSDSTIRRNSAANGGGINNGGGTAPDKSLGTVRVERTAIGRNVAASNGGGVNNDGDGNVAIVDSPISANKAGAEGGGIGNNDKGSVSVSGSTVTTNRAINGAGFNNGGDGAVTVTRTELTLNKATEDGGGLRGDLDGDGGLTVTNAVINENEAGQDGGGVVIDSGIVRLVDSTIARNAAEGNGGGFSFRGDAFATPGGVPVAILEGSIVADNTAEGVGGGIDSDGDGTFRVEGSTVSGNTALSGGGISSLQDSAMSLDTTRISRNTAVRDNGTGGEGGGILFRGDAELAITRSTLDHNAARNGAGIDTAGDAQISAENTTFFENVAQTEGGGLDNDGSADVVLRHTTFSRNTAASGGNVNNLAGDSSGGAILLQDSILAYAIAPPGSTVEDCMGGIISLGGNLDRRDTCDLRGPGDIVRRDPRLLPLAWNGGPTPTVGLASDSPAIDAASDDCPPPQTDQRGASRPFGAGCDIGAFESAFDSPCVVKSRVVNADADSWIDQNSAQANKGSDGSLKVRSQGGGNNVRTLVRFALPAVPQGCRVTGARLRLYAPSATGGRTVHALRLTAPWSESDVTWANQPATTGTASSAPAGLGWVEWSVRAQVAAMYAGANHGFLIKDAVEDGPGSEQQFFSREKAPDPTPQLVVEMGP